jgi:hypothetical protein
MRRFDLGVFEPADRTPYDSLDGERRRGNDLGDLVSLATSSAPSYNAPAAQNAPPS